MAIEPTMADVIRRVAPTLPNRRALCLGYPDVLALGAAPFSDELRAVAAWHKWKQAVQPADTFFAWLNLQPEYWDVTKARGPEKIVDLNEVESGDYLPGTIGGAWANYTCLAPQSSFALVIDPGTLEHIANIGNCWRTICAVTAVGGAVIHCNPFGWANHGMYAISPTAYIDVYEANGFEIETLAELSGPLDNRTIRDAKTTARFNAAPNAVMLCVARKVKDVAFSWPIQSKYRRNPTLKAAQ